jgi:oligopeptide transport system permease protein
MSDAPARHSARQSDEESLQILDHPEAAGGPGPTDASAASAVAVGGDVPLRQASLWGDAWQQLRKKPLFVISAFLIAVFAFMAITPGLFVKTAAALTNQVDADPTPDPDPVVECDILRSARPPSSRHLFGTDVQGCDYLARVIYGARVSIAIGFLVVGSAVLIAVVLGSLAGYYGRAWDAVVARIADVVFAIPYILGGIVLLAALGDRGLLQVSLVLVLLGWPTIMRLMRSTVLSVKEMDYVQAARSLGASDFRVMWTHILPNAIAPVLVYATIFVGITISAEAVLSFLGVGLELPAISWGLQIQQAETRILLTPHLLLFPASFLVVLVLSFILLGDSLRDALDPKLQR